MLQVDPENRITIREALQHEWFSKTQNNEHQHIKLEIFKSIKKYRAKSKLWHEAMKILIQYLSEDQLKELQNAFLEIDQSRTGFVTAYDIDAAMQRNGYLMAREEFKILVHNIHYIGKGKLNYTQFLIASIDKKRSLDEEAMWIVFRHFDLVSNN